MATSLIQDARSLWGDGSRRVQRTYANCRDLWSELCNHRYFQSVRSFDWHSIQLGQILVASALINLLELSTPLYINIVYTSILPKRANESLILLTVLVVLAMAAGGWLKALRLSLVGRESAQIEHRKRLDAYARFVNTPVARFLANNASVHLARLNSINLLRDESAVQTLTVAVDLAFSLLFIFVFMLLGGILVLPVVIGIAIYFFKSLAFSREFEALNRDKDKLDIERQHYQSQVLDSVDLIKTNGLNNQFLVDGEPLQERWSWQRMTNTTAIGNYQALGSYISQLTFACVVTMGALMIIGDRLLVGALAACLLLVGKIFSPWQQAMTFWNSFRRLGHSFDEYEALMQEPLELSSGSATFMPAMQEQLQLQIGSSVALTCRYGEALLVRDQDYGNHVKDLFVKLIRADRDDGILLDGQNLSTFSTESLREAFAYCAPSSQFFEGTILQNICKFQPSRYQKSAYFWSVLLGLDSEIRALPSGYDTTLGTAKPSGLSIDSQYLLQVIAALSGTASVVLLDLSDCSFGKRFVEGLELILQRCAGRKTILVNGSGRVLERLIANQSTLVLTPASGG